MAQEQNTAQISQSLKCNGCGAVLQFIPGTHNLMCDHCGTVNKLSPEGKSELIPIDYDEINAQISSLKNSGDPLSIKCGSCGSQTVLENNFIAGQCSFCSSPLVLLLNNSTRYIRPHYIIPFTINEEQARACFNKWLKTLSFFRPSNLTEHIHNDPGTRLKGYYVPFWVLNADVSTSYHGERGEHYTDSDGRTQTNWYNVSDTIVTYYRKMLVSATNLLTPGNMIGLQNWDEDQIVLFDERYLSGFTAENFQLSPKEAFDIKSPAMDVDIKRQILRDIGGDAHRIVSFNSQYQSRDLSCLLCPVWISTINYNNKDYQYVINGCNGKVSGDYPRSITKKLAAWAVVILVMVGIILYFNPHFFSDFVTELKKPSK